MGSSLGRELDLCGQAPLGRWGGCSPRRKARRDAQGTSICTNHLAADRVRWQFHRNPSLLKYQLPAVTCSSALIPRYPCPQVLRDIVHQIQSPSLPPMADPCSERIETDCRRSLPPWVRVNGVDPHPHLPPSQCDGCTPSQQVTIISPTGLSSSASSNLGLFPH